MASLFELACPLVHHPLNKIITGARRTYNYKNKQQFEYVARYFHVNFNSRHYGMRRMTVTLLVATEILSRTHTNSREHQHDNKN